MSNKFDYASLERANKRALSCTANIRAEVEHFQVDEQLPFEAEGSGGHVMLQLRKRETNTDWIAKQLARFAKVPDVAIGFAGMKDRHALTTQWFTINMEGHEEPDWRQFDCDEWQIIQQTRHNKKLKRGVLSGNRFHIVLTDVGGDRAVWQESLEQLAQQGVPNYFAEQRFGHHLGNLDKADIWLQGGRAPKKRQQRSIYLSAGRSWLFNLVLSERIKQQSWNKCIAGDVMQLAGTRASHFLAEDNDASLQARLDSFDIHPTGPLWGRGTALNAADSLAVEQQVLASWQTWCEGLERVGLKQERRALRLAPQQFTWQFDGSRLALDFFLPSGSYATSVLRELAVITDVSQRNYDVATPILDSKHDNRS